MNSNSSVIQLRSVTEANKARRQLANYRIRSNVEKIHSGRSGCVYGIRVYDDPQKICRLLSTVNIECGETVGKEGRT